METETFETETDLCFAILAADVFGYAVSPDACEYDVSLDDVGTAIRNFFFIDG